MNLPIPDKSLVNPPKSSSTDGVSPNVVNSMMLQVDKLLPFLENIKNSSSLTGEQLEALLRLCSNYKATLQNDSTILGYMKGLTHSVELVDQTPIKRPQYRVPVALHADFKRKLTEYLQADILEPSTSPWSLPLIVKRKKDGDVRLILDATSVNKKTKKMDYPIMRISDTFLKLKEKRWFSSIDLKAGYHQIMLDVESRQFFAFRTIFGKYAFKRMPMGAVNSGVFFQKAMETLLKDISSEGILIYQDDILVASDTVEEHLSLLKIIFQRFQEAGVHINLKKSSLCNKELTFLGHVVTEGSFRPSSENLAAIDAIPPPTSKKLLRRFLGKINFYGRFIPALSHVASPLTSLLKSKSKSITMTPEALSSFHSIKEIISRNTVLQFPDFSRPFVISIQVSSTALVGVLEQGEPNKLLPIGYYSKKLTEAQQKYSTVERNALAILSVLEHFHHIVHGYTVHVYSDHKAIEYLRLLKDGSTRATDWMCRISKYDPSYIFSKEGHAITNLIKDTVIPMENVKKPLEGDDMVPETTCVVQNISVPATASDVQCLPITRVYTDGSCLNNGKDTAAAGYGVFWENNLLPEVFEPLVGLQTNNRAELQAIIHALKDSIGAGIQEIVLVSDSSYAISNITRNMPVWEKRNWTTARGKSINNIAEFKEIHDLCSNILVHWELVPGHSGNYGNDKAHMLASEGRKSRDTVSVVNDINVVPECLPESEVMAIRTETSLRGRNFSVEDIAKFQQEDREMIYLRNQCRDSEKSLDWTDGIRLYNSEKLTYAKGIVSLGKSRKIKVDAVYLPRGQREDIILYYHNNIWTGHPNYNQMCEEVLKCYFWDTFRSDIRKILQTCPVCQKGNARLKKAPVLDFVKPTIPFDKIAIDIVGPLITASSGEKYILTMVDLFSRFVVVLSLQDSTAPTIAKAIERHFVSIFGVPNSLVSDRASYFKGQIFSEVCKLLHIKHCLTGPYRPATNGMVERMNKTIKKQLIYICHQASKSWPTKLHLVQFACNNSVNNSTGVSPNSLIFGKTLNFPGWNQPITLSQNTDPNGYIRELQLNLLTIQDLASENEIISRTKRNDNINKRRTLQNFKLGDLVLYKSFPRGKTRKSGFRLLYEGPYKIVKIISPVSYDIGPTTGIPERSTTKRAHCDRLKPYFSMTPEGPPLITSKPTGDVLPPSLESPTQWVESHCVDAPEEPTLPLPIPVEEDKLQEANTPPSTPKTNPSFARYFTHSKGRLGVDEFQKYKFNRGKISIKKD